MILRPFETFDEENMTVILADHTVRKTYMLPDFDSPKDAKPLFDRLMGLSKDNSRFVRCISLHGQAIGFLNDVEIENGCIEVGYVLSPACHNRGLMTQALELAIRELFSLGYKTVVAGAFEENAASIRVMVKNGMTKMDKEEIIPYRGADHNCVYYQITNQE